MKVTHNVEMGNKKLQHVDRKDHIDPELKILR